MAALAHWLFAALPIAVLLLAIAVARLAVPRAAALGLTISALTALAMGTLSISTVAQATTDAASAALSILYAVWPAVFLYELMNASGSFNTIRRWARTYSRDDLALVLFFGWVLSSFLQSLTGFGVPVAVCAPFLVALGIRPVPAVVMTLLGHAWGNTYGTLGLAWGALVELGNPPDTATTAWYTTIFLWIINLTGPLLACWIYGRMAALRHGLPLVVTLSAVMGGGQLLVGQVNPTVAAFVPATLALLTLWLAWRLGWYTAPWTCPSRVVRSDAHDLTAEDPAAPSRREVTRAVLPFLTLSLACVVVFLIPALSRALAAVKVAGVPVFVHAGFVLTLAALSAAVLTTPAPAPAGDSGGRRRAALRAGTQKLVGTSLGIILLLTMAQILAHTGQIAILARGVASVMGAGFLPFASLVGTLGAFVTSSNMSSNILFAGFQSEVATHLQAAPSLLLAAQTGGGAAGSVIGPATIMLGASTAGARGQEAEILRPLLAISLAQSALIGGLVLLIGGLG